MVEISIVPFKHKYLQQIIELHKSQSYMQIEHITMKNLPKIGFIALMGNEPIACGFLRRVEGGFAQIDTLASNAFFGSEIRHKGISVVVDSLVKEAKHLKLRGIIAITKDVGVLSRAMNMGFKTDNQIVLGLPIEPD